MPARRPTTALATAGWVAAAALTGVIAWRAVAVLDADGPQTGLLSTAEVAAALAEARAAASATPTSSPTATPTSTPTQSPTGTPTSTPTSSPTETTSPPTDPGGSVEQVRTWPVTGGTVSASCAGATITLLAATPADGWTVEVGSTGPEHVEVELRSGELESKVEATCVAGVPTANVREDDD